MKTIRLTIAGLLLPLVFQAQSLTGLWMGAISNDSNTVRKDQSYEIVLTQYKNKVYGYSRSTFIVHDTLFYIVKKVLGTIDGDKCEVKDQEIIANNFPGRLDKGVKMVSTFYLDTQDSVWRMGGDWKTNKTKKYYAVSGKLDLAQEKNLDRSKLFPHLEELKLANDIPFYADSKKPNLPPAKSDPVSSSVAMNTSKADEKKPQRVIKENKPNKSTETKSEKSDLVKNNPTSKSTPEQEKIASQSDQPDRQDTKQPAVAVNNPKENNKTAPVTVNNSSKETLATKTAPVEIKPVAPVAAANVAERKITPPQIVNFKSDSLELALYDNGEVDGDTVSVLLNGEIIMPRQGLKATAIKKTIYLTPGKDDSLVMVLYAENLGKYPPNTGLLVVHDGEDTYQVRFSADLQQNASVIFRRKKK